MKYLKFDGRYREDPSVGRAAATATMRIMGRIEDACLDGLPFHVARERILAEEIPDLRKAFGPVVADRVGRVVQWQDETSMRPEVRREIKRRRTAAIAAAVLPKHGRIMRAVQRASLAITGYPL